VKTVDLVASAAASRGRLRSIAAICAACCCILAISLPAVFFLAGYASLRADIRIEAETRARAITKMIHDHPVFWRFKLTELSALLDDHLNDEHFSSARIVDLKGATIISRAAQPQEPLIRQPADFYDAGQHAGQIEITGSARALVLDTLRVVR
jgi:hypothetical protein